MSKTKGGVGYRIVSRNLTKLRLALHLNMKGGYKNQSIYIAIREKESDK